MISDQESRVDVRPERNGPVVDKLSCLVGQESWEILGLHRKRQAGRAAPQKDQHRLQLHADPRL